MDLLNSLLTVLFMSLICHRHLTVALYTYSRQFNSDDIENGDDINDVIKRSDGKGTCTCTCETKPASEQQQQHLQEPAAVTTGIYPKPVEKHIPSSAALIRTSLLRTAAAAAGSGGGNRETKTTKPPQPAATHSKSSSSGHSGSSGIVKVPPMEDYMYDQPLAAGLNELDSHNKQDETSNNEPDKNSNWNTDSRFPWKQLPDTMCFREMCDSDSECCLRFNICDRSAKVCVDCWYGSTCSQDRDCCLKYPYCHQEWKTGPDGTRFVSGGKCTNEQP